MPEDKISSEDISSDIVALQKRVEDLENDKEDLEILVETITEHSTDLENEIYEKNQIMLKYLEQVQLVTQAAAAVETESFEIDSDNSVSQRDDELGQLARVFQNMANQVKIREKKLRQQVQELQIKIDREKQSEQVAEIVQTDSFKNLKQKLQKMKKNKGK
ncbi:MAG TPA: histidine kinase [Cyanothece sp. UBA12306]|nr:histidine kinase [Cyanothece sp. UBA12306]